MSNYFHRYYYGGLNTPARPIRENHPMPDTITTVSSSAVRVTDGLFSATFTRAQAENRLEVENLQQQADAALRESVAFACTKSKLINTYSPTVQASNVSLTVARAKAILDALKAPLFKVDDLVKSTANPRTLYIVRGTSPFLRIEAIQTGKVFTVSDSDLHLLYLVRVVAV